MLGLIGVRLTTKLLIDALAMEQRLDSWPLTTSEVTGVLGKRQELLIRGLQELAHHGFLHSLEEICVTEFDGIPERHRRHMGYPMFAVFSCRYV